MPRHTKPIVIVTAGPTRAYLDSVRYISNYSTGALGFEICSKLKKRGFDVVAIVGPTPLDFESLGLRKTVRVETNEQMRRAVLKLGRTERPSLAIFAAAVLDFEPKVVRKGKVRSTEKSWTVRLVPAPKIVREFQRQFPWVQRIEFKLEVTRSRLILGQKLLDQHKCLAVVLNHLGDIHSGKHSAIIAVRDGRVYHPKKKKEIAQRIAEIITRQWRA